jgi:hypothetical protein
MEREKLFVSFTSGYLVDTFTLGKDLYNRWVQNRFLDGGK